MPIISKQFNSKVTALKDRFKANKEIGHNGVKGFSNEEELSDLLREVVPQKYKLGSGVIENSNGEQSSESDIFIYDDEILPPYIKKSKTFSPVEAVKYLFEVKSSLNSKELKTTVKKFNKFKAIGGLSPTALFSFSSALKGSELSRYHKIDNDFFTCPAISVLCVSGKCFYRKITKEYYIKNYHSEDKLVKHLIDKEMNPKLIEVFRNLLTDDSFLNKLSRSKFAQMIKSSIVFENQIDNYKDKKLILNGFNYSNTTFKIHQWIGFESTSNDVELSFLSEVSSSLSIENMGKYLTDAQGKVKIFANCCEDMWGNISGQDFNSNGLGYDLTVQPNFEIKDGIPRIFIEPNNGGKH